MPNTRLASLAVLLIVGCGHAAPGSPDAGSLATRLRPRLPTGAVLDPAGTFRDIGQMPLGMVLSPGGRRIVLLMGGWREQGVQVTDRDGTITQTLRQPAGFVGLAFAPDGRSLWASGGNQDVVYRYRWEQDAATLADSVILAPRKPKQGSGTSYPAGIAFSPDGAHLYVAENLADSLAVIDVASGKVVQRLATGRYPYGVAVTPAGTVFVSNWGASVLSVFRTAGARLEPEAPLAAGRHPSALLLNADGSRLFVASGSTDRVTVVDTRSRAVVATLLDPPPAGPAEGSTPNALALSPDGTRLFVAEADANAVAIIPLSAAASGVAAARGDDKLAGRVPMGWYPTSVIAAGDTLIVASGKGRGTGPNTDGPGPREARDRAGVRQNPNSYTLGQYDGGLSIVPGGATLANAPLDAMTKRVAHANGWDAPPGARRLPPIEHVIYIIKENRTYDQVLGDLAGADGDTSLVYFGRTVTPNHHALAERFGIFDRFFVNAEASPDGHNWSMAAYTTDYLQKTVPSNYSGRGRTYDYEGTNRGGFGAKDIPIDDVAEPAMGYLWDLAQRKGITFRNFGEYVAPGDEEEGNLPAAYVGVKPYLEAHTHHAFPGYDLRIPDQRRADVWLQELARYTREGSMPALQIVRLPNDHTAGARAGAPTPRAYVADNDLALGRLIEGLSRSPFWRSTVVFVLEDDAQNGPDHVDSHRSPLLVISPWARAGVTHRFTNTTDVIATIEQLLGLGSLSQFDHFGRPLREIWRETPDTTPWVALTPGIPLDQKNPAAGRAAEQSRRLDLHIEDVADEQLFNEVLWLAVKGEGKPYPGATRMAATAEALRGR